MPAASPAILPHPGRPYFSCTCRQPARAAVAVQRELVQQGGRAMVPKGFVQVRGRELTVDGKAVRLRGLNYGNWMLVEHYMHGLPWVEYQMRAVMQRTLGPERARAYWDTFMDTFVSDADFAFIRDAGFNLLRLPFDYRHFGGDRTCTSYGERGFDYFDRFIELCRHHGLYVLLDMHAAPGVQARDWNAGSAFGESFFWDHDEFWDRMASLWERIAARYANEPYVCGYNVMCEPVAPSNELFNRFNLRMIEAIRRVDPTHLIVLESNLWGKDIASFGDEVFADPQVIPSPHFYPRPVEQFDQLTTPTDDPAPPRDIGAALRTQFASYHDVERIPRPVLVGEFGVSRWDTDDTLKRREQFAGTVDMLEQLGFHWCMWAYKDLGTLGIMRPRADTPWRRFLARPDVQALRTAFGEEIKPLVQRLAARVPQIDSEDTALLTTQTRHHWDALVLPRIVSILDSYSTDELRAMASSFAFEHCECFEEKLRLVRPS
ncbi:MAG: cellulase family glycosylhydrolase [Chitinivibrionales bacterium]|nr:cellulase family glycosylhydrolase [Chitinivibrionales bacterium]